jgi:heparanase 1
MRFALWASVTSAVVVAFGNTACGQPAHDAGKVSVDPRTLARLGTVDERYQSYNVEMLEVTGGDFWKPYGAPTVSAPSSPANSVPAGMDPNAYQYRRPIDLANPRLRALGPAYVRVSGTWADTTYFADADPPPAQPPAGFNNVLSRSLWQGVVDFSKAVNAKIVSLFAVSPGTRDKWCVVPGPGTPLARLHALGRRGHRRGRIHERPDDGRDGWRAPRL